MARIHRTDIYDYDTLPTFDDYVIGTDDGDSLRTKSYRIGDIAALITGGGSFLTLTDTESSYVGQAGLVPTVNGTEDGLEFTAVAGGGTLQETYDLSLSQPQIVTTDALGPLTVRNGAASDNTNVFEIENKVGTNIFEVNGHTITARGPLKIEDVTPHLAIDTWNTGNHGNTTQGGIYFNSAGNLQIFNPSSISTAWNTIINNSNNTSTRTVTLKDESGTVVFLESNNIFTGNNQFSGSLATVFDQGVQVGDGTSDAIGNRVQFTNVTSPSSLQSASFPSLSFSGDNLIVNRSGADTEDTYYELNADNLTAPRTLTIQNASGTLAYLTDIPTISDVAYNATSWDGNTDGASKNAIRDKFESLSGGNTTVYSTHTLTDQLNATNTISELLTLTIPANTMADGDIITFEANFVIAAISTDVMGLIIDGASAQGTTNTGGSITNAHFRGWAVRVGSVIEFAYVIHYDGTTDPHTGEYTSASITFTSDFDFSIAGGGTTSSSGDVTLKNGMIKLHSSG